MLIIILIIMIMQGYDKATRTIQNIRSIAAQVIKTKPSQGVKDYIPDCTFSSKPS